jgi:hypothetical protein
MELARANLPRLAVPFMLLVAIAGYLIGHSTSTAPSQSPSLEQPHEVSSAIGSLEYGSSSGWRVASATASVPGLSIVHATVLAPHGESAGAGLIAGRLQDAGSAPLPLLFVRRLARLPDTQVVDLENTEAYRYTRLAIPGFDRELTLFVVPSAASSKAVIACYASAAEAATMAECDRIAATLTTPSSEAESDEGLAPEAAYANAVAGTVRRVDALRLELRPQIRAPATGASKAIARLTAGFAAAAGSFSAVQAPAAAGWARATLAASLWSQRDAYAALGRAVENAQSAAYTAAEAQLEAAEGTFDSALTDFALIGYR